MIKVKELKGVKSLRALNVFHTLMLGLKMLPEYQHEAYEEFFEKVEGMPLGDQEKLIREATLFVELKEDEVVSLATFCTDSNGVSFTPENLKNAKVEDIFEIIVAVCKEIIQIKIDLVSNDEKKN